MTAQLRMLVQDESLAPTQGSDVLTDGFEATREDFFLDGPVCRRLAVLDFDPDSGQLTRPARWVPPKLGRQQGHYDVAADLAPQAPAFMQMHTFATVLKTMYMYEEPDALGRRLSWGFAGPQLLIVPRAGRWANAFYERETRSLQFFYFSPPGPVGRDTVFLSLARDIVSHETGHAILDGIAPDLYGALTPQTLALHEAVADLTALLMAFRSKKLVTLVLKETKGSILESNAFNALAEEVGRALDPTDRAEYLRSVLNNFGLRDVDALEPHDLSQVLSGALYTLMVSLFADQKRRNGFNTERKDWLAIAGKSLGIAANRFKRMVIRGLDYLPPGNVSFADYGRAILAADQAAYPEDLDHVREELRNEFARRQIVERADDLLVETNTESSALDDVDLRDLLESDWAAYRFADRNRKLLGIPPDVPFDVRPRLYVEKENFPKRGIHTFQRECLFKVRWRRIEPNPLEAGGVSQRAITVGTALAIDWDSKRIRACLSSDLSAPMQESRDGLLRRLAAQGTLQVGAAALGSDGEPLGTVIPGRVVDGILSVEGTGRTLHIMRDE